MNKPLSILIVEDTPTDAELMIYELRKGGIDFNCRVVETEPDFINAIEAMEIDLILSDYNLPAFSGLRALDIVRANCPEIPFLFVSGTIGEEIAVETLKLGAVDYVIKERLFRLVPSVHRALAEVREHREKEQAASALKESERRFRDLYDNAPNAYFSIDAGDLVVTGCNRHAVTLLGYDIQSLNSMPLLDLFADTPKGRPHAQTVVDRFMAGKSIHDAELQMLHKDGNPIWISLSMTPIFNATGVIVAARAIAIDISERKSLESQLMQSQKLEAIGTLAGGIAHDFNNILVSILGYTELSFGKAKPGSELEEDLKEIYTAGLRAKELVYQILTYCRQTEQEFKPIRIHLIVKEAMKMLRPSLPATIEIKTRIGTRSTILADPTRIHQILMNLCTNAYHAMEESGGILEIQLDDIRIIDADSLDCPRLEPGDYVRLIVSDTGTGMSPQVLKSIFEPYFTTRKKGEGTGLGLSVVLGIVKSLGGEIQVRSQLDQGSVFTVFFPKTDHPTATEPVSEGVISGGNERILLVDDEPAIAKVATRILEVGGYNVTFYTDSYSALEQFQASPLNYDLVITDMTMPGLSGDLLSAELMRIRPGIPVILCTGYNKKTTPETIRTMGIRAMVQKPFSKERLLSAVRNTLDAMSVNDTVPENNP